MPSLQFLTAFFLVMFPLVYSPGPANTLFASNGAQFGFRRSMPFMTGINAGFIIQSLVAGYGISELLMRVPVLFTVMRYAGIAYITWLGLLFLKAAMKEAKEQLHCLSFKDGLLVTAINPKAWVMQIMMFSQFLSYADMMHAGVVKLALLLAVLNVSGHTVWILFGSVLLSRATGIFPPRAQNAVFAAMLFASIYFLI